MSHPWTAEQRAAIEETGAELALSAAAGSGKTAVLVERVLRAAVGAPGEPPVQLDRLLVVTFTRAAAAELRARLHEALSGAFAARREAGQRLETLRAQLAALPRARISTIHSFCAEIIRRYGHLRGLQLGRVLGEDEADLMRHELATQLIDRELGGGDAKLRGAALAWGGFDGVGPEDLSRVRFAKGLRRLVLELDRFRQSLVEPARWYGAHVDLPPLDPARFAAEHPLIRQLDEKLRAWAARETEAQERFGAELAVELPQAQLLVLLERRRAALKRLSLDAGWEECRGLLGELWRKQEDIRYKPSLLTGHRRDVPKDSPWYARIGGQGEGLKRRAEKWRALFAADWAAVAGAENQSRESLVALWRLAERFAGQYAARKRERALLDYADLERGALAVLAAEDAGARLPRDAEGRVVPSAAAHELRRRFALVLVDEYQDVNPLQDAIINLVTRDAPAGPAAGGRPRFVVGDLKQSIYAFRLATPQLFGRALAELAALGPPAGGALKLTHNFRSRPLLLAAVNHLFDGLMDDQLGGEDYTRNRLVPALDYGRLFEEKGVAPLADQPVGLHLVRLRQEQDPADEENGGASPEDEEAAPGVYERVAAVLSAIKAEGRPLYDKEHGEVRPVSWRDMVVLMRTARGRVEPLLAELERAGVPAYAPGRGGFYERPEVADALSLLRVIDNPRQDIALAAVLRGPAVGLSPVQLLEVARAAAQPGADLWERLQRYLTAAPTAELAERLAAFTEALARWRTAVRREPLPDLLWRLYGETGLLPAAAALKRGRQRLANLTRLHDLACEFTAFERQGLARFLQFIDLSRRAAGDLEEAPVLTEAQDVVRVMTVHQAKGLEFPVVVLADVQRRFNLQELGQDVIWQREAGLGGRHVDLRADPPRRTGTLAYTLVREERRREIVSEELRILYVALTRARERLELVGAAGPKLFDGEAGEPPGEDARCWLDWLGPKLAGAIREASLSGAARRAGEDGCWEVQVHEAAAELEEHAAAEAVPRLNAADCQQLRERLGYRYPYPAAARLPAKLSVTEIISRGEPEEAERLPQAIRQAYGPVPPKAPLPAFLEAEREPSAAEIGSAVHRLLAALEFGAESDAASIEQLRARLVAEGALEERAAARIDCAAVARLAADLSPLIEAEGCRAYRELPVALLVPAREFAEPLPADGEAGGEAAHPDDSVYVQGVLDLLLVDGDRALVLDYKTDRNADARQLRERYGRQLDWYCRAVSALLPDCRVEWALYGLDGAGLVGPYPWRL